MVRFATVLAAVLTMGFQAAPPTLPPRLVALAEDAAAARAFDHMALKAAGADRDRPFQRHVLTLLEPLVAAGETSRSNYAYLYDRIAVGENRPQRYGSQGRCVAQGVWAPNDLEDPDRVQALRDENDLGSLAEYIAHMHQYCADFAG